MVIITDKSTPVYIEEIFNFISVRQPYFALSELSIQNECLSAKLRPEQLLGNEKGPISAAEAGRHLAILGSCLIGLVFNKKARHYYLAYSAVLERISLQTEYNGEDLIVQAYNASFQKRFASVSTELRNMQNEVILKLSIDYHVLSDNLFKRQFNDYKMEHEEPSFLNPYTSSFNLNELIIDGRVLKCSIGPVEAKDVSGHFPGYPSIPVAILMYTLTKTAGVLLSSIQENPNVNFLVKRAIVKAPTLARVGQKINIKTDLISFNDNLYIFNSIAYQENGSICGELEIHTIILS